MLTELEESGVQPPNKFTVIGTTCKDINSQVSAVNSKREIIAMMDNNNTDFRKITAGEVQLFCRLPPEITETNYFNISSLTIDEENNVYIVAQCEPADNVHNKLFVYDAKGNMKHQSPLNCLDKNFDDAPCTISITKDKKIILGFCFDGEIHVCDSTGELEFSFRTNEHHADLLSISDENEIIAADWFSKFVYIYTEEGNVKRKFKVPEDHDVWDLAFNHVTKEVIVLTDGPRCNWILSYSTIREKRETVQSPFYLGHLTSHPSGPVALVDNQSVLYIQ